MGTAEPMYASQTLQLLVVHVPHDFDHDVTHDLEQHVTALMHRVCCRSAKGFVSVSPHKYDSSLLAVRHHAHCCHMISVNNRRSRCCWAVGLAGQPTDSGSTAIGMLLEILT